jgi:proline iminopeptidase
VTRPALDWFDDSVLTSDGVEFRIRVGGDSEGLPVLMLSGGPGCVNYLPDAPQGSGIRSIASDPRGVGTSGGGPHDLAQAVSDLEEIREHLGLQHWTVAGHSSGADLGLAYALDRPESVSHLMAACSTGIQNDREWHATYAALADTEPHVDIEFEPDVHRSLLTSWRAWIKQPALLYRLSTMKIPTTLSWLTTTSARPGRSHNSRS